MKELQKIELGQPVVGEAILKLLRKGSYQLFDLDTKASKKGLSSKKQVTLKPNQDIKDASLIPDKNYFAYVTHYQKDGVSMPSLYCVNSEEEARQIYLKYVNHEVNYVVWLSSDYTWDQLKTVLNDLDKLDTVNKAELLVMSRVKNINNQDLDPNVLAKRVKTYNQTVANRTTLMQSFGFWGSRSKQNSAERKGLCPDSRKYGSV